jgi:hypothetical protein
VRVFSSISTSTSRSLCSIPGRDLERFARRLADG